jgi:hypothetical protein
MRRAGTRQELRSFPAGVLWALAGPYDALHSERRGRAAGAAVGGPVAAARGGDGAVRSIGRRQDQRGQPAAPELRRAGAYRLSS